MRYLYDTSNWKTHRGGQKCRKCQKTKSSFSQLPFQPRSQRQPSKTQPPIEPISVPCPGLTSESDERIAQYLSRTSVKFGGAPSKDKLAEELEDDDQATYTGLDGEKKQKVLRMERQRAKWELHHDIGAVYSTECTQIVKEIGDDCKPCEKCLHLWSEHLFKNTVRRPMPAPENLKYRTKEHQGDSLSVLYAKMPGVKALVEQVFAVIFLM